MGIVVKPFRFREKAVRRHFHTVFGQSPYWNISVTPSFDWCFAYTSKKANFACRFFKGLNTESLLKTSVFYASLLNSKFLSDKLKSKLQQLNGNAHISQMERPHFTDGTPTFHRWNAHISQMMCDEFYTYIHSVLYL